MIDSLLKIDTFLFFFINNTLANPVLDWFMPFITRQENWYPAFLLIIIGLLWKGGRQGRIVVLLLIPVIVLSDQITSSLLKPLVDRTRPCQAYEALGTVRALIGVKTSPSFPSSHASNAFAAAMFFAIFYPKRKWIYFTVATLIALSRVYVGVHYPVDVTVGAVIGAFCAVLVYGSYQLFRRSKAQVLEKNLNDFE